MPNFFCGSLVVVRCGPQGLSVLFDRPGDRTAAVAAGYSYLLVATDARSTSRDRLRAMPCQKEENERSEVKSTKTIRMSLSREQPPARVERAQQEQDYAASRSGHAGCRLFFLRCKRECGGLKPLPGVMPGFSANTRTRDVRPCSHVRMFACSLLYPAEKTELPRTIPARCRSRETKARLKVARNGAGLLANPRIGARFER